MADDLKRYLNTCAYEGIVFPATGFTTQSGHDKVEHSAYLVPGADNEPTGLKARRFRFTIPFINTLVGNGSWDTPLFPDVFQRVDEKFATKPQGLFVHPTRGPITVQVDDWEEQIKERVRNGLFLVVSMTEQNAESSVNLRDASADAPSDPATEMSSNAAAADTAITAMNLAGPAIPILALATAPPPAVTPVVSAQLAYLEGAPRSYAEATQSIGTIVQAVQAALDSPAIAGIDGHDARVALEALRAATYAYQDQYLGSQRPWIYVVPVTMGLKRIAAVLYGDPAKAAVLRSTNQIPDEVWVPAGTILQVFPG